MTCLGSSMDVIRRRSIERPVALAIWLYRSEPDEVFTCSGSFRIRLPRDLTLRSTQGVMSYDFGFAGILKRPDQFCWMKRPAGCEESNGRICGGSLFWKSC